MTSDHLQLLSQSPEDITSIHDLLIEIEYKSQMICEALNIPEPYLQLLTNTAFCSFVYYDSKSASISPVGILGTLFTLGGWVEEKKFRNQISSEFIALLEKFKLIETIKDDYVRSTVSITELDGALFFSDRMVDRSPEMIQLTQNSTNHVDPPNYSSISLYHYIKKNMIMKKEKLLDIGCGTGCQSILADFYYDSITGIDINPRCILFSQINAQLNNTPIHFKTDNCLRYSTTECFDTIYFNVPSVPQYRKDLTKIDTYTSKFGYSLTLDFLNKKLPDMMKPDGTCIIWSIFAVNKEKGSISGILKNEMINVDNYDIKIICEKESPFGLSEENIANNVIPRDSYLLANTNDREIYLDFLKENNIKCIIPALIQVTHKKGKYPAVEEVQISSFV